MLILQIVLIKFINQRIISTNINGLLKKDPRGTNYLNILNSNSDMIISI